MHSIIHSFIYYEDLCSALKGYNFSSQHIWKGKFYEAYKISDWSRRSTKGSPFQSKGSTTYKARFCLIAVWAKGTIGSPCSVEHRKRRPGPSMLCSRGHEIDRGEAQQQLPDPIMYEILVWTGTQWNYIQHISGNIAKTLGCIWKVTPTAQPEGQQQSEHSVYSSRAAMKEWVDSIHGRPYKSYYVNL